MKRIAMVLMALAMVFAAVPVSAAESSPVGNVGQYRYITPTPPIEPMVSFSPCTYTDCKGIVSLVCSGDMKSDNTLAPFACTYEEHNDYGTCNHYRVIYYNSGKCNTCYRSVEYLAAEYGFTNTAHNHGYKHVYLINGTTYTTVYSPACYI